MAYGGFKKYSERLKNSETEVPIRILSAIHAGPGQITFGSSRVQKADLTLVFRAKESNPAVLFIHNYHGKGPYGHYEGHLDNCRLNDQTEETSCKRKPQSDKLDIFRYKLALGWSMVNSSRLIVDYSISHACDFFCGNKINSLLIQRKQYISLHELLHTDFPQPNDTIFIPQSTSSTRKILNKKHLENDIISGKATGFVTLKGGCEKKSGNACDFFGFCVQKITPTSKMLSEFTINQIKLFFNLTTILEVENFLSKLPERTLNTCTFLGEETVSTTYLKWLIEERGFSNYFITHFIAYKFSNYSSEFLGPILQKRHDFKKLGNVTASAAAKLAMNSNYGYKGMEASNYSKTRITTGTRLINYRLKKMGHLDLRHVTMLGLVKIPIKRKSSKNNKKQKISKMRLFCEREAIEDENDDDDDDNYDDDDDDDDDDDNEKYLKEDLEFCYLSDEDQQNISHDHNYHYNVTPVLVNSTPKYKIEMLYAITFSGKQTKIKNCLPKAIAILSNSKKFFLGHIKILLECLDPRLAELCYVDTDSCFFSMSFPSLDECLLKEKKDEFYFRNIIADENAILSCHGKMKCEGIFTAANFRSLKVYRLYNDLEQPLPSQISHCKGVSTLTAVELPENMFNVFQEEQIYVTRNSLRPNRSGQILITKESKKLAIPFNLKRFVCADTIHTFPLCFVPE